MHVYDNIPSFTADLHATPIYLDNEDENHEVPLEHWSSD